MSSERRYTVGVDVGGTFTDCVAIDDGGDVIIGKASSTPPDFENGFLAALAAAGARVGLSGEELAARADTIAHGATVGTNALVENRVATVGLLTTAGHADALFVMQGGQRLVGEDLAYVARVAGHQKPAPLVPKRLIREIDERMAVDGKAVVAFNESQCRQAIAELLEEGAESFAISFLWSTANPAHEHAAVRLIREMAPGAFVSNSVDVVARTGEYQRTVATVINSLIGSVTSNYLLKLEEKLADAGYRGRLRIMSCSGGVIDSSLARQLPILTIGSGPVAGLIGAARLARLMSSTQDGKGVHVLTGDMGGTTFDVGVIRDGEPLARASTKHTQYEYYVPTRDVRSIGAGGGSIIHFDEVTQSLRVGPRSAGARPGPAAYRRGGTEPTITDADLVLGYLNPANFLGGSMTMALDASRHALARVGERLGFSAEETAAAAARIVDAQMADAIRLASLQQGYDPRTYTMYAFGGAGAVHCPAVASQLEIAKLVVPLGDLASGWSAFGVASSDTFLVQEAPAVLPAPFDPTRMNQVWETLESRLTELLSQQRLTESEVEWARFVDIRYALQINEVSVAVPLGVYNETTAAGVLATFEQEYARLFGEGTGYADAGFVLTNMRMSARVPSKAAGLSTASASANGNTPTVEPTRTRGVIWYEVGLDPVETPVYDGTRVLAGSISGPAIVEFPSTTLVLRSGHRATVEPGGNIVVDTGGHSAAT